MAVAAGIIPSMGTRLPFTIAADAIALVGLLATAPGLPIACRDGYRHGLRHARCAPRDDGGVSWPSRRLLMVIFVASMISATTALPAIAENLATQTLALYPSLAFTAIAFTLVLVGRETRAFPIDKPGDGISSSP